MCMTGSAIRSKVVTGIVKYAVGPVAGILMAALTDTVKWRLVKYISIYSTTRWIGTHAKHCWFHCLTDKFCGIDADQRLVFDYLTSMRMHLPFQLLLYCLQRPE